MRVQEREGLGLGREGVWEGSAGSLGGRGLDARRRVQVGARVGPGAWVREWRVLIASSAPR